MRRWLPLAGVWALLAVAASVVVVAATRPLPAPDVVTANAIVQVAQERWSAPPVVGDFPDGPDFTVVSAGGGVVVARGAPISDDLADVRARAPALDVTVDDRVVGRAYVLDSVSAAVAEQGRLVSGLAVGALALVGLALTVFAAWTDRRVLAPFRRLRRFATRVAHGDLDAPLAMDRGNAFGAFTESFEVLRAELAAARAAEAEASASKRKLVAELSHDIRTPLAALQATAEVGLVKASGAVERGRLQTILGQSQRIGGLVDDLFRGGDIATALDVRLAPIPSTDLRAMLTDADASGALATFEVPECLIVADRRRLQQVIDNVVSNAAKYAGTPIEVTGRLDDDLLTVTVADTGPGLPEEEFGLVLGRHVRGASAAGKPGSGLGLYIADQLLARMGGALAVRNTATGFAVDLVLAVAGGGQGIEASGTRVP